MLARLAHYDIPAEVMILEVCISALPDAIGLRNARQRAFAGAP
jgi:hypothetical protein